MRHPRILVQLDSDMHASVFDAVVATDAGVEQLLQYAAIEPTNVLPLVHGAMFTRSPAELKNTALFVGGSNVAVGDAIGEEISQAFFGPIRVSVMLDGNGSNTTASAAVLCCQRHMDVTGTQSLVLGGTGPVGGRVARLLLKQGATVHLASRDLARAESACEQILEKVGSEYKDQLKAIDTSVSGALDTELESSQSVFGCGAAGITLLDADQMSRAENLKVAVDLNAVPPAGLQGIEATDKAVERSGRIDYGAIGVGGLKMKIHRASIEALFDRNDLFLDAEEIYEIGQQLEAAKAAAS